MAMNIKKINSGVIGTVSVLVLLAFYGSATFAQTATPATPAVPATAPPSNYAVDVSTGQATLASNPVAAQQAKEIKAAETKSGEVDKEKAEVKETVEPEEAKEIPEASESKNESDKKGESSGSDKKSDNGSNNDGQENSSTEPVDTTNTGDQQ